MHTRHFKIRNSRNPCLVASTHIINLSVESTLSPHLQLVSRTKSIACSCGDNVLWKIGTSKTSALLGHQSRCELKRKQQLLQDYGISGTSGPPTADQVREYVTLWVSENVRLHSIVNDRYVSHLSSLKSHAILIGCSASYADPLGDSQASPAPHDSHTGHSDDVPVDSKVHQNQNCSKLFALQMIRFAVIHSATGTSQSAPYCVRHVSKSKWTGLPWPHPIPSRGHEQVHIAGEAFCA
jgi:hypothetical protein